MFIIEYKRQNNSMQCNYSKLLSLRQSLIQSILNHASHHFDPLCPRNHHLGGRAIHRQHHQRTRDEQGHPQRNWLRAGQRGQIGLRMRRGQPVWMSQGLLLVLLYRFWNSYFRNEQRMVLADRRRIGRQKLRQMYNQKRL